MKRVAFCADAPFIVGIMNHAVAIIIRVIARQILARPVVYRTIPAVNINISMLLTYNTPSVSKCGVTFYRNDASASILSLK